MLNGINQSKYQFYSRNNSSPSFKGKGLGLEKVLKSDILEIKGSETTAKVFTNNIDCRTFEQIRKICSHPVFTNLPIRIMPDTHAGKTAVVGFTAPIGKEGKVIPSLISGDIGCGMLCVKIDTNGKDIDFGKLDDTIRKRVAISIHSKAPNLDNIEKGFDQLIENLCKKYNAKPRKSIQALGTLGGGNHFVELNRNKNGETFLVIHSGSRKFGQEVFGYHQKIAEVQNPYEIKDLSYLSDDEAKEYLEDMKIAVKYSQLNRRIIADEILKNMEWNEISSFESIHNYISKDGIIRKGAISAEADQRIIIPLNMRDGSIIAKGKGNRDWNQSAPHGAGRQLSRTEASELISLEDFQKEMKGIHSSCISKSTLDESPQAYKNANEIIGNINDTAEIETIIKPIYNFKN